MAAKKKTPEVPTKHFDTKDTEFCVYEVYHESQKTVYYIRGDQAKYLSKITLEGFIGLPAGLNLYKSGYGLGKKGFYLLSSIEKYLSHGKVLDLKITNKGAKSINVTTTKVSISLPLLDIKNLLTKLSRINEDSNNEIKEAVGSFLSTKFPSKIKISTEDFDEYKGGEVAALFRRKKVADKLNEEDLESIKNFFPKIFETSLKGKKRGVKAERTALIQKTKTTTDKIYLDEVIKEFETNLSKKTLPEEDWQKFLSEKVFRFVANYVTSVEKQNVSISVSYPDFVMVDVYGFVDVFEIKRHDTGLLSLDTDHDNYYWKPEAVKAVSQIENYIEEIVRNSDDYIRAVKRKKGVNIRVIRPRGYIIAGTSKQFSNKKEFADYRKLSCSFKNISFILYDELLENLKNLRSKL